MVESTKSSEPLVSAVTPTYNRSSTLERAIKSIINQSYDNLEIIVVDDGSTDETPSVISSQFDGDVQYIQLQENQGANTARNVGINNASGEYIAFLDSDDEWKENKVEKQVKQFRNSRGDVGVVYTGIESMDEQGKVVGVNAPNYNGDVFIKMLHDDLPGLFSSAMISQEVWEDCGPLDISLESGQDWIFFTQCAKKWDFKAIPEPLVRCHYQQSNRISRNHLPERRYKEYLDRFEEDINRLDFRLRMSVKSSHMAKVGHGKISNNDITSARKYFFLSVLYDPTKLKIWANFFASLGGPKTYTMLRNFKRRIVNFRSQYID